MLNQPGSPSFGDYRQINRKEYELIEIFTDSRLLGSALEQAKQATPQAKCEFRSVRRLKSEYGDYALYGYGQCTDEQIEANEDRLLAKREKASKAKTKAELSRIRSQLEKLL